MIEPIQRCVEEIDIVLIGEAMLTQTEQWLSACERCAENAVFTLNYLLDALTGCDPNVTEYVMCRAARCPSCSGEITEKTLVVV